MSSLSELLKYALDVGASDVHLVSNEKPVFRQYGSLVEGGVDVMSAAALIGILDEVVPTHLKSVFETQHEVDFSMDEQDVGRFRCNAFMERGRPSLALRLVLTEVPTFEALRLPSILADLALSNSGILLASGPTGCGKSTTLARMIQHINEKTNKRIITIEDPIELLFKNKRSVILQREIGTDTDSFGAALRSALRQDPDVIMIGEMRDAASFRAALTMAETGHLVLSTLHTDTASQSVTRILNFFPHEEREVIRLSLADNLRAVVCQKILKAVGGGLVPAVEILVNTPMVNKLLATNALEKLYAAIETDSDSGMQTFNQSMHALIKDNLINEETALIHSLNAAQLKMMLEGINLDEGRRIIE